MGDELSLELFRAKPRAIPSSELSIILQRERERERERERKREGGREGHGISASQAVLNLR